MTDHTSTPQASRSRGAAAAANISEAGAILRSLDFLFFPEVDATLRKYRPRPLTALEVWFDLNKRAHAMRDRTFSPPPLKEFRDIWRCGLGRVQRLVRWFKEKGGVAVLEDGRWRIPMADPAALWSSSDPSDFSSWPKPWTRGQMGSYIAACARANPTGQFRWQRKELIRLSGWSAAQLSACLSHFVSRQWIQRAHTPDGLAWQLYVIQDVYPEAWFWYWLEIDPSLWYRQLTPLEMWIDLYEHCPFCVSRPKLGTAWGDYSPSWVWHQLKVLKDEGRVRLEPAKITIQILISDPNLPVELPVLRKRSKQGLSDTLAWRALLGHSDDMNNPFSVGLDELQREWGWNRDVLSFLRRLERMGAIAISPFKNQATAICLNQDWSPQLIDSSAAHETGARQKLKLESFNLSLFKEIDPHFDLKLPNPRSKNKLWSRQRLWLAILEYAQAALRRGERSFVLPLEELAGRSGHTPDGVLVFIESLIVARAGAGAIKRVRKRSGPRPSLYEFADVDPTTPWFDLNSNWLKPPADLRNRRLSTTERCIDLLRRLQANETFSHEDLNKAWHTRTAESFMKMVTGRGQRKVIGAFEVKSQGNGTESVYSIGPRWKLPPPVINRDASTTVAAHPRSRGGRPKAVSDEVRKRDQEATFLPPRKWCEVRDAIGIPLTPTVKKFGSWVKAYDSRDADIRQYLMEKKAAKKKE